MASEHSRSQSPARDRPRTASRSRSRSPRSPARSQSPRRSIPPRSRSRSQSLTPRGRRVNGHAANRSISRDRSAQVSPSRRSAEPSRRSVTPDRPSPQRSTKVVVERLTKNVKEGHLRDIFGYYGEIREIDMPMNRQFNTNRGTAYILYEEASAAEAAIAHMHEGQLDGAVLNVSIVLPRRRFSPSPPPSRRLQAFNEGIAQGGRGRGRPEPAFRGGRYRSPPRNYSPPNRYRRPDRDGRDYPVHRPRSYSRSRSRSRSPRRSRSSSRRSRRSYSRSPPPRGGGYRRRDSPPRRRLSSPRRDSPPGRGGTGAGGRGGGGYRRRSRSYSSYGSPDRRSRSRSPGRGGWRR